VSLLSALDVWLPGFRLADKGAMEARIAALVGDRYSTNGADGIASHLSGHASPRGCPLVVERGALTIWAMNLDDPFMAKKIEVTVTDDLDGSENAETISFGFDGVTYEVDLAKKNRAKLERALAPFVKAGRKVSAHPRRRAGTGRSGGPSVDRAAVRAWASKQGLKISDRGRISAEILKKYESDH